MRKFAAFLVSEITSINIFHCIKKIISAVKVNKKAIFLLHSLFSSQCKKIDTHTSEEIRDVRIPWMDYHLQLYDDDSKNPLTRRLKFHSFV